jgi:hypothetical protein
MKRAEVTAAISQLAEMDRTSAGTQAYEFARNLLRDKMQTVTGTRQAQEWMLALSLYFSAATNSDGDCRFATLLALMEERLHKMQSNVPDSELFEPLVDFPPSLARCLYALSALPRELVVKGHSELRDILNSAV